MLTVVFTLGLFAAGIPVISAEMLSVCEGPSCYRWQPTPQLVTELTGFGLPVATYLIYKLGLEVLFVLSSCLIAAVLVWRRSDEPMAPMHALANSQLGELQKFLLYGYPPRRPPVTFDGTRGNSRRQIARESRQIHLTSCGRTSSCSSSS